MGLLDFLFSLFTRRQPTHLLRSQPITTANPQRAPVSFASTRVEDAPVLNGRAAVDQYFALHDRIERAIRDHDYETAVDCAKQSFPLIPALVRAEKRQYGTFVIHRSLAVEHGSKLMLAYGEREGLESAAKHLRATRATVDWAEEVEECIAQLGIVDAILRAATETPGVVQVKLRKELAVEDGREFAHVCYWMERVGRLRREKRGSSYALFVT